MYKKILITGSGSGFGKLTVNTLAAKGYTIVATMRDVSGRNAATAEEFKALGVHVIDMDVTNDASVESGVASAIELMGGLDVVFNNAGVGVLGMQEFFTVEDYKRLFEINVFGVQRVNREAVPFLRKQGKGLIIYTSSLLGRVAMPFYGPYQSSKWALEAMASNYRIELSGFGIENCIVEPGGFPTSFTENLMNPSDLSRVGEYGEFANVPGQALAGFEQFLANNPQQNPQTVADAVLELIEKPYGEKPFRTPVDFVGMGAAVAPYNDQLETLETALFTNFGMAAMRSVKK